MPSAPCSTSASSTAVSSVPVGLGLVRQRLGGDRRVAQREHERAAVVGVEVAHADRTVALRLELVGGGDLEVALERGAQPLAVADLGEQPVGGEDGQARVLERDQAHEHVAGAALLVVHARGLVAVVAVGDQQLGVGAARRGPPRSPPGRRRATAGASVPSSSVTSAHGSVSQVRRERAPRRPGRVVVEAEDGGEVRVRGAREPQPVLLRAGVRALVRPDPARAVVLDRHAREEPVAGAAAPVGAGVVLLERPQRRARRRGRGCRRAATARTPRRRGRTGRRPAGGRSRRRCRASGRAARRAARRRSRRRAGRRRAGGRRRGRGRSGVL